MRPGRSHDVQPTYANTNAGQATASAVIPTQTRRFHDRLASSVVTDSCAAYASDQTPLATVTATKLRTSDVSPRDRFRRAYAATENDASAATSKGAVYGVGCHSIDTDCITVADKKEPDRTS